VAGIDLWLSKRMIFWRVQFGLVVGFQRHEQKNHSNFHLIKVGKV
jgi:hypothetical protein